PGARTKNDGFFQRRSSMKERILRLGVMAAGVAAAMLGAAAPSVAQDSSWEHPKTPWGDPDLQGMWPVNHMTGVPLVRPPQFGTRNVLTEEEYQQREAQLNRRNEAYEREIESGRMGMGHWAEADRKSTRLNSSHVKNSYAVVCSKSKTQPADVQKIGR